MMKCLLNRVVIKVSGNNIVRILQGLLSQDLLQQATQVGQKSIFYTYLLSPKGKFEADMFVVRINSDEVLIDINNKFAPLVEQKLNAFNFKKTFVINRVELNVFVEQGQQSKYDSLADPRMPDKLPKRIYMVPVEESGTSDFSEEYNNILINNGILDGVFIPHYSSPLLYGAKEQNGISVTKGCYLGQEGIMMALSSGNISKKILRAIILPNGELIALPRFGDIKVKDKQAVNDNALAETLTVTTNNPKVALVRVDSEVKEGAILIGKTHFIPVEP